MTELTLSAIAFRHNDRLWEVVKVGNRWFARDDRGSDTGPYAEAEQAIDWVKSIRLTFARERSEHLSPLPTERESSRDELKPESPPNE